MVLLLAGRSVWLTVRRNRESNLMRAAYSSSDAFHRTHGYQGVLQRPLEQVGDFRRGRRWRGTNLLNKGGVSVLLEAIRAMLCQKCSVSEVRWRSAFWVHRRTSETPEQASQNAYLCKTPWRWFLHVGPSYSENTLKGRSCNTSLWSAQVSACVPDNSTQTTQNWLPSTSRHYSTSLPHISSPLFRVPCANPRLDRQAARRACNRRATSPQF